MLDLQKPFHTFEFFPPRTEAGLANLLDRITRLAQAPLRRPVAISVTWGAGGATADRSLELAEKIVQLGFEVILHLTCTNMPKAKVDHALKTAKRLGIRNILALRGDPPRPDEYSTSDNPLPDFFQHADDLVRYIRAEYGSQFCIGVAGYPTPHPDSADATDDLHWLKAKVDAGAEFIITQLFYDVAGFKTWVSACRNKGIHVPIIPGIMPIQNYASFRRLVKLTQCDVPARIMADLEPIKADDAAVKRYGAKLASDMVKRLMNTVDGVHFCTLNLEKSVRTIMEDLEWTSMKATNVPRNKYIEGDDLHDHVEKLSVSPKEASVLAQYGLSHHQLPPQPKSGLGAQTEDSWDEYPNGRFTDVRSPAYGEIDGWGTGLKSNAASALKEWGYPTTPSDLSSLFTSYLRSSPSVPTTPFCDLPLSPESQTILSPLLQLNSTDKQYWTVGSQPAVDAEDSSHPIHGWGPSGGYVFQKAFVEFFVPYREVERLAERLQGREGEYVLYGSNRKGEFLTNTTQETVNAVTWGVFPGKEIIQSTIIEETSFMAWKEEAFQIWADWASLYPKQSASRKLLEGISEEWWLVTIIAHDYKDKDGLWELLLA